MFDVAGLVERLKDVKWVWHRRGVELGLASLNATLVDTVPGRKTYAMNPVG